MTVVKVGRLDKVNQMYKGFDRVHNLDKKLQNLKNIDNIFKTYQNLYYSYNFTKLDILIKFFKSFLGTWVRKVSEEAVRIKCLKKELFKHRANMNSPQSVLHSFSDFFSLNHACCRSSRNRSESLGTSGVICLCWREKYCRPILHKYDSPEHTNTG